MHVNYFYFNIYLLNTKDQLLIPKNTLENKTDNDLPSGAHILVKEIK